MHCQRYHKVYLYHPLPRQPQLNTSLFGKQLFFSHQLPVVSLSNMRIILVLTNQHWIAELLTLRVKVSLNYTNSKPDWKLWQSYNLKCFSTHYENIITHSVLYACQSLCYFYATTFSPEYKFSHFLSTLSSKPIHMVVLKCYEWWQVFVFLCQTGHVQHLISQWSPGISLYNRNCRESENNPQEEKYPVNSHSWNEDGKFKTEIRGEHLVCLIDLDEKGCRLTVFRFRLAQQRCWTHKVTWNNASKFLL